MGDFAAFGTAENTEPNFAKDSLIFALVGRCVGVVLGEAESGPVHPSPGVGVEVTASPPTDPGRSTSLPSVMPPESVGTPVDCSKSVGWPWPWL